MTPNIAPFASARAASLRRRLREAEDEHDLIRRAFCSGADAAALVADNRRWEALGMAIAALAALIAEACAASALCDARPGGGLLAARLSEAIDDLMDEPAWAVVDAAARLSEAEQAEVQGARA